MDTSVYKPNIWTRKRYCEAGLVGLVGFLMIYSVCVYYEEFHVYQQEQKMWNNWEGCKQTTHFKKGVDACGEAGRRVKHSYLIQIIMYILGRMYEGVNTVCSYVGSFAMASIVATVIKRFLFF